MSDFLSQFEKPKEPEVVVEKSKDLKDIVDESVELKDIVDESEELKDIVVKKRGAAFSAEEITIDPTYHYIKLRKTIIVCVTILIIFFISVVIFVISFFDVVVSYENESLVEMQKWADKEGIELDVDYQSSDLVNLDYVVSQDYESGKIINKFDVLKVVVSSGPDENQVVEIPDFKNKTNADIELFIEQKKLDKAKIEFEFDDSVKKDLFIRSEFQEGVNEKNYTRNKEVIFKVSKGREADQKNVKLPNFDGKNQSDVETWSSENMMYPKFNGIYSELPVGTVISQDVKVGTMLSPKSVVNFEVSKGVGNAVPSFYGLNQKEAEQLALESNVAISVYTKYSDVKNGHLIYQSHDVGSAVYEGDTVKLTYSLGLPYIDDMTGMSQKEAADMIVMMNLDGANLSYKFVNQSCSQELPKGKVCKVSPQGQYVAVGSMVTIYIQK